MPIGNRPILFYGLDAIRAAGITEVGIVVGDTAEEIKAAVGDGSRFGIKATYLQQEAPLGLAHAVLISQEYMAGESFLMFLGDNLLRDGVSDIVRDFEAHRPNCQILLTQVPNPNEFGVAELRDGRVVRLEEKPAQPKSDLALVGVYLFDQTVFEAVNAITPSKRGELEITDAIQYLLDSGREVKSHLVTGWWKDTGKLEDMLEANRLVLSAMERNVRGMVDAATQIDGNVVIADGAVVERSVLRGPLVLGAGCVVRDSYVGPFTSIGDGVHVERSEIEYSIVLERSVIREMPARIEGSLIGKDVVLSGAARTPKALRFMIGDSSQVDVL